MSFGKVLKAVMNSIQSRVVILLQSGTEIMNYYDINKKIKCYLSNISRIDVHKQSYKIVQRVVILNGLFSTLENDIANIENEVMEYLNNGYSLVGGLKLSSVSTPGIVFVAQNLVKNLT
jgi:hypothetical protein